MPVRRAVVHLAILGDEHEAVQHGGRNDQTVCRIAVLRRAALFRPVQRVGSRRDGRRNRQYTEWRRTVRDDCGADRLGIARIGEMAGQLQQADVADCELLGLILDESKDGGRKRFLRAFGIVDGAMPNVSVEEIFHRASEPHSAAGMEGFPTGMAEPLAARWVQHPSNGLCLT